MTDVPTRAFSPVALRFFSLLMRRQTGDALKLIDQRLKRQRPEFVHLEILLPVIGLAGSKAALGDITPAETHCIFSEIGQALDQCKAAMPRQPLLGRKMLAMTLPGEMHGAGLNIISDWLWRDGWETEKMACGRDESPAAQQILHASPDMLAISCSIPRQVALVRRLIRRIRREAFCGSIWIGGMAINAFPELFTRSGADHTARDIIAFTRQLAEQFHYPTATPPEF